ncbi:MAG: DivIVA domain-containing protein [Clostridia bacterium]|nr:DivIVA domain-containing protein [Clostridia bacterium]
MLTPDRIKEKVFQTTGRGSYRSEDVDMFMSEVHASYEQMFKENGDLVRKISILAKKVEEYRADEESLKMALLNAQKLADRIVAEAKETAANEVASVKGVTDKLREDAAAEVEGLISNAKAEAEKILADANNEAKDILGNINRKVTHESLVYEMIQKEASDFKSKLIAMYREHITLINDLPEIVEEQLNEESQVEEVVETPVEPAYEEVVEETVEEIDETTEEVQDEAPEVEIEEDFTVVEDEEPVVIFDEVDEFVPVEEITDKVVETEVVEEYSEPISDEVFKNFEPADDEPVFAEKKSFKLDLSQIDFADDDDYNPAPAKSLFDNVGVIEDDSDDSSDEAPSSPFKSFFKKK